MADEMAHEIPAEVAARIAHESRAELGAESLAKQQGFRTAGQFVATVTGRSSGEASRLVRVGEATAPRSDLLGALPRLGPADRGPRLALGHVEPVGERRLVAEPLRRLAHHGGHVQAEDASLILLADCRDVGGDLVLHGVSSCP